MRPGAGAVAGSVAALGLALVALWSAGSQVAALARFPGPPHEQALRDALMVDLGTASRTAGGGETLRSRIEQLAARSPLSPDPYLVAGALSEQATGDQSADALYVAAMRRDPRSKAAHFMLARKDFLTGNNRDGLRHLVVLSNLSPAAAPEVSKVLVGLAADPGFDALVRDFLKDEPGQSEALFAAMAGDPTLARRIFSLAPKRSTATPPAPWASGMVATLLTAGNVDSAVAAWVRFVGGPDPRREPLRDGKFEGEDRPPFGWQLEGGDGGTIARGKGGVEIELFGDTPTRLARQTLVLAPGTYRLGMGGQWPPRLLQWRLSCPQSAVPFASVSGGGNFTVPVECLFQSLELWSTPTTDGGSATAHISDVRIDRVTP